MKRESLGRGAYDTKAPQASGWDALQFDERGFDLKNLERLKACFLKDYRRLDRYNHVAAEINQRVLNAMLRDSNVSTEALLQDDCRELIFPTDSHLESLHGRHRIQAARDVLPLTEKWWTVDLYLSGRHEL